MTHQSTSIYYKAKKYEQKKDEVPDSSFVLHDNNFTQSVS